MRGVILAGGLGSRLFPLTKVTNKHLLPVGTEPMIYHPIKQLVSAGITDILVITSTVHMGDIVRCLGSGSDFNCQLSYKVQETEGGIAHALLLAEAFSNKQKLCVLLADNIFEYSIAPYVNSFKKQKNGARVLLKSVGDPERYGVAALDEKQVLEIQEKPSSPKSSYAVVGLYMYDNEVFEIIRSIEPSERGELEITSVNNIYIKNNLLKYDICHGRWADAGTHESIIDANNLLNEINNNIKLWD